MVLITLYLSLSLVQYLCIWKYVRKYNIRVVECATAPILYYVSWNRWKIYDRTTYARLRNKTQKKRKKKKAHTKDGWDRELEWDTHTHILMALKFDGNFYSLRIYIGFSLRFGCFILRKYFRDQKIGILVARMRRLFIRKVDIWFWISIKKLFWWQHLRMGLS